MNLLLTGATGLIGRHVLQCLPPEDSVQALVRRATAETTNAGGQPLIADLADPGFVAALPGEIDAVIHLAQSRNFRAFPDSALEVSEVNLHSTLRLIEWARRAGASHFVYASSGGVYGTSHRAFTEEDGLPPPGPLDYYLGTKLSAELLLAPFRSHLTVIILRFFFVYGPGQEDTMLVPRLIKRVADGTPVPLSSQTGIRINPIHATDAATALVKSLGLQSSATFNIAGSETVSIRDLCDLIGGITGHSPKYRIQDSGGQDQDLIGENSRMLEHLHTPTVDLKTGLSEIASAEYREANCR